MQSRMFALQMGAVCAMSASAAMAVEISLYEHAQFGGRRMTLREAVENFDRTNFNDRASSIVIRSGIWVLFGCLFSWQLPSPWSGPMRRDRSGNE